MPVWLAVLIGFLVIDAIAFPFFLRHVRKRRAAMAVTDPVRGEFTVLRVDRRGRGVAVEIDGEVRLPGADPVRLRHGCLVRAGGAPMVGDVLPVVVQRGDLTRMNVLWDEVEPPRRSRGE
ncbi:hypothetical protein Afil01_69030 [Actinorhabdospora filicis]|uniref:Uncharacterized protein n=1 Tax=Actinorhabdospora filicis TaxID=1785913 RepID=A0A9W6ST90_9ACTN|nr:hypothetical protein [Actinorhabdospora filicis]GLZ82096.1 hypothetical protein Afil01_69030 [Actinorhabdospora filicis]